jgi:LPS-assembly protein
LFPSFTNSTTLGSGITTPYYWAINNDKDLTFTPKFYTKENFLYLNEYRQAFSKGFLTLDTSYTEGFKNTSTKKPKGSRNHIFGNFDWNFSKDDSYESNLLINVERTSNDTYFRKHNINTTLVNAENTNLTNKISYDYVNDDSYLNIQTNVYENLRGSTNARYEYVLPSILFGKTFFTEKYGSFDFKSNALHNNYEVNKYKTVFNNDLIWKPGKYLSANGFVSSFEGMLRNSNYKAKKTDDLKNGKTNNELNGVLAYKTSLPMKKEGSNYANFFSPNFMFRYAPGHMKNISSNSESLNYLTLYSLNKTSEIEDGISAVLGFDFKSKEKEGDKIIRERLSLSLGQIFNYERNTDMPSKTSLDQKMSDVVGEFNYNFSSIGNLNYKFLVDHNLESLNYNEISTGLNFGRIGFNLSYLEENKHIGNEKYASSGVVLNFNDNNKLDFSTKKNFKTDSTEFYNMRYQYAIDCLTAGLVYRREFYEDADLEPNNSLMFTLTFIPFGKVSSPDLNQ